MHISVLYYELIDNLNVSADGIFVDCTGGGGGHASLLLERLGENGRLIILDRDIDAVARLKDKFAEDKRVVVVHSNFADIDTALLSRNIEKVDGIYADFGVSSFQLQEAGRGFSFRKDGPLDMRMDQRQKLTARDIVNEYDEQSLYRVIRDYGEDQFAKNIAKHIVQARAEKPVETTFELNEIIKAAIPAKIRAAGGHPSKRTFQAIRIECNRELDVLRDSLEDFVNMLNPKGRLCIITFHSLEDRIVKNFFRDMENPCTCPPEFPVCVCGKIPFGKTVPKKPILPTEEEMAVNSRSKSAKLRVFERI